ncbi:unnamed protein product [Nezara viridula]|uniref:Uncharacterized protein n=1 Tax=Nezara viridula TaxID=85310 RepID=A0A9P0DYC9_NEZVI|nr:unnamed protein product [Nezara viridula]
MTVVIRSRTFLSFSFHQNFLHQEAQSLI